jgi:signal transduction histidine kinase
MNPQREFMSETFHTLAQPITALRATVELGLRKNLSEHASHLVLEDCLGLIDRLMQDLALLREIASLDEQSPLQLCDGQGLLEGCVEELAPVAEDRGIALHLNAERSLMRCNAALLQRAIFVLLDEMIAGAAGGSQILVSLHPRKDEFLLEMIPGTPPGQRQKLGHKLMRFAGGSGIHFDSGCTSVTFRNSTYSYVPAIHSSDQRLLTPGVATNIS